MNIRLSRRLLAAAGAGAAMLALGGCVDDGYGYGGGVGYNAYAGYDGYYGDSYYDGYGPGYGYGWYDGYWYPGSGVFIYDRGGHRYPWRDGDRDHWRGGNWHGGPGGWHGGPDAGHGGPGGWHGRDHSTQGGPPPGVPAPSAQAPRGFNGGDGYRGRSPATQGGFGGGYGRSGGHHGH